MGQSGTKTSVYEIYYIIFGINVNIKLVLRVKDNGDGSLILICYVKLRNLREGQFVIIGQNTH